MKPGRRPYDKKVEIKAPSTGAHMQTVLSEPFDIRDPDDPECVALRKAFCGRGERPARDVDAFMRRERDAMTAGGYRYWLCDRGPLASRLGEMAPKVLLVHGHLEPGTPKVAVVGPRRPDDYGSIVAAAVSSRLGLAGVTLVSGGAAGVDTIAHLEALEAGSGTICVLGCGFDRPFPPDNKELFSRIAATKGGCLLSEYAPGQAASTWTFPERNRIVAAISDAVIVIQGGFGSGALITARCALNAGTPTFAVPADIQWNASSGSNALLSLGARPLCRPSDLRVVPALSGLDLEGSFLETVFRVPGWAQMLKPPSRRAVRYRQSPLASKILELIHEGTETAGMNVSDICGATSATASAVQSALLELEIAGLVIRAPGGLFLASTCREC